MTTILASHHERAMLSDSSALAGDTVIPMDKIMRLSDGSLLATAGSVRGGERFIDWYEGGRVGDCPKLGGSFEALMLNDEGLFYYDKKGAMMRVTTGVMGIGSGGKAALAAHLAGASLKKAVEIACAIDGYSKPPVHWEKL